jgi:hypothetical protein
MGRRLRVVDPKTGEVIGTAQWADTTWGLLKCYVIDPKTGRIRVDRHLREQEFKIVQREFDLIDRLTDKPIHSVRLPGNTLVADTDWTTGVTSYDRAGRLGE